MRTAHKLFPFCECLQAPELTEEQKEYIAKAAADKEATAAEDVEARGPTSFFHGKADKDYQVRRRLWTFTPACCW
jgi:pre-mRNA-processing factor 17